MKRSVLILILLAGLNLFGQQIPFCGKYGPLNELLSENPSYQNFIDSLPLSNYAYRTTSNEEDDFKIYIPVVFHVICDNSQSSVNITDQQITSQLLALNASFSNFNNHTNGVDTKIVFCFAKTDPLGNATNGITRNTNGQNKYYIFHNGASTDEISLRNTDDWPSNHYLNIWVANLVDSTPNGEQDFIAKSHFPFVFDFIKDGIIINSKYCGNNIGTATLTNFNNGKILVHEVGHWFGLFHVFENSRIQIDCSVDNNANCDNCTGTSANGDQIADTDPCSGPATCDSYWITNKNSRYSCNSSCQVQTTVISAENYMDYNFTQYMNFFSPDQKTRMRAMLNQYRNYFYNYSKINPNIFPIECGPPSNIQNDNDFNVGCTYRKFPDEWLRVNGYEGTYLELCEGTRIIYNPFNETTKTCVAKVCQERVVACSDPEFPCDGECHTNFDGHCGKICEAAGACSCCDFFRSIQLKLLYVCADNNTCALEKSVWKTVKCDEPFANMDVLSLLGIGLGNTSYCILKVAMVDENGVWRQGDRYIRFIPDDLTVPDFPVVTTNYSSDIKAMNTITILDCSSMYNNKTFIAGNEIRIQGESAISGNIECNLKTGYVSCNSSMARPAVENLTQDSPLTSGSKNEDLSGEMAAYYSFLKGESNLRNQSSKDALNLSPNPSSTGIFKIVSGNNDQIVKVDMFNNLGQNVTFDYDIARSYFDLSANLNGLYFCKVLYKNGESKTVTLVKSSE